MKYDIFISSSPKDKAIVELISNVLHARGYTNCSLDYFLVYSDNLEENLLHFINNCSLFLFISSKNSFESRWCLRELDYAIALGKRVLTVVIAACTLPRRASHSALVNSISAVVGPEGNLSFHQNT